MKFTVGAIALSIILFASPAAAVEWVCAWYDSSFFYGITDEGDVWLFSPTSPNGELRRIGTFGAGPWVDFGGADGQMLALNAQGEVWAMPMNTLGVPWLYAALPSDSSWCALSAEADGGAGFAITCAGEVWSVSSDPIYFGTFAAPIPATRSSFGTMKTRYEHEGSD